MSDVKGAYSIKSQSIINKPIIQRNSLKIYMVHGELNEWNWNNY